MIIYIYLYSDTLHKIQVVEETISHISMDNKNIYIAVPLLQPIHRNIIAELYGMSLTGWCTEANERGALWERAHLVSEFIIFIILIA